MEPIELQRIARLVEMNRQQLTSLGEQIDNLNNALIEHQQIISALSSLLENNSENVLIPLGSGVQLIANQTSNPGVVIDIGSGIQAERPISEAIEILNSRVVDIQELIDTLKKEFDEKEQNVKQLATKFTEEAESLEEVRKTDELDKEPAEHPPPKKRRRNISGELTLDD